VLGVEGRAWLLAELRPPNSEFLYRFGGSFCLPRFIQSARRAPQRGPQSGPAGIGGRAGRLSPYGSRGLLAMTRQAGSLRIGKSMQTPRDRIAVGACTWVFLTAHRLGAWRGHAVEPGFGLSQSIEQPLHILAIGRGLSECAAGGRSSPLCGCSPFQEAARRRRRNRDRGRSQARRPRLDERGGLRRCRQLRRRDPRLVRRRTHRLGRRLPRGSPGGGRLIGRCSADRSHGAVTLRGAHGRCIGLRPRQQVLRRLAHDGLAVGPYEDWQQADLFLGSTHLVPRQPDAVGGAEIIVAHVSGQLVRPKDILAIGRRLVQLAAAQLVVIECIHDQLALGLNRPMPLVVKDHPPAETPRRRLPGPIEHGVGPHGDHLVGLGQLARIAFSGRPRNRLLEVKGLAAGEGRCRDGGDKNQACAAL